jgi:hypothetical protein
VRVLAVLCLLASIAHADPDPSPSSSAGIQIYGGVQLYGRSRESMMLPCIGVEYRAPIGTEITVHGSIVPLLVLLFAGAEVAVNQQVACWGRTCIQVGFQVAGFLASGAPDGGIPTEELWYGPRLGTQVRLGSRFLSIALGPSIIEYNYANPYVPKTTALGLSSVVRMSLTAW